MQWNTLEEIMDKEDADFSLFEVGGFDVNLVNLLRHSIKQIGVKSFLQGQIQVKNLMKLPYLIILCLQVLGFHIHLTPSWEGISIDNDIQHYTHVIIHIWLELKLLQMGLKPPSYEFKDRPHYF